MKIQLKEYVWLLSMWIVSLLLMILLFPNQKDNPLEKVSNIIQAQAVISLVLITWYYSIRTKELVNEQIRFRSDTKRKNEIDFMERRIEQFYSPLFIYLMEMRKNIHTNTESSFRELGEVLRKSNSLYFKKRYMTKIDHEKFISLFTLAFELSIDYENKKYEGSADKRSIFDHELRVIRELFVKEWDSVEKEIFSFYMPTAKIEAGAEKEPSAPGEVTP